MESLKYVLLIGVCFGGLNAGTAEAELVYPGRTWQIKRPDEVGLDELKLKQMSDYAGGFGCVVKGGCMVYTWGDPSRSKDVASAVKPLYTHFLIKAIESGKLKGFDDRVSRFEPRLKSLSVFPFSTA